MAKKLEIELREVEGSGRSIKMVWCQHDGDYLSIKNCNDEYCGYLMAIQKKRERIGGPVNVDIWCGFEMKINGE